MSKNVILIIYDGPMMAYNTC